MEWDFKDFAWDSTQDHYDDHHQLEKKDETDLAALVGSSCSSGAAEPFNLVDLKLGNSEEVAPIAMKKLQNVPKSSPRNRRQLNNIRSDHHQNLKVSSSSSSPSCLVDNCKTDLSRGREYHRRHRVCELHSKTPIVTIRSQQKRFCQQCSRFHSLAEFDEVKRSCRKRLNGHNQRRRKPKPESFYFTSKNFLSAYKGPRILQFGSPQIYATTNVRNMWPLESKSAADHHPMLYSGHQRLHAIDHQRIPPNSFTNNEESDKQFIFLQKNVTKVGVFNHAAAAPHAFPQQPFPPISAAAASPQSTGAAAGHAVSSDCTARGIDPGCALYLLSSSYPTQSSTNTGPNYLAQSNLVTSSSYSPPTEMKSFSEYPSYCSNELVENKFFSEA